jgi:hypothetical protein
VQSANIHGNILQIFFCADYLNDASVFTVNNTSFTKSEKAILIRITVVCGNGGFPA